jgi:hypothetical protein
VRQDAQIATQRQLHLAEPTAHELADCAKELVAKARAEGRTLSATDAVAKARRELVKS